MELARDTGTEGAFSATGGLGELASWTRGGVSGRTSSVFCNVKGSLGCRGLGRDDDGRGDGTPDSGEGVGNNSFWTR